MIDKNEKTVIECSCGAHLLKIQSDVECFKDVDSNKTRIRQEYFLAMF